MTTFNSPSVALNAANELVNAAVQKATEMKLPVAVAVVDQSGILKAFARMDGAPLIAVETAIKKAKLAAGFGFPTGDAWYDFIKDDPILLHGAPQLPDFILLGGGVPLKSDGVICGAIGVSGGHYKQDEEIGNEAIKSFGAFNV